MQTSLALLVASGLVFQRGTPPDAIYSFKHALVQDAAYGQRQLASDPGGGLVYAGRGGTGIDTAELTEVTNGAPSAPLNSNDHSYSRHGNSLGHATAHTDPEYETTRIPRAHRPIGQLYCSDTARRAATTKIPERNPPSMI
jgi:hypothetical protein